MKKYRIRILPLALSICLLTALSLSIILLPRSSALAAVYAAETDAELCKTYSKQSSLIGAPTVVCDVTSKSVYDGLMSDVTPSNAILRFDKDKNVTDADGKVIGSFYDIYKSFDHKIIPIAYLSDNAAADAFDDMMRNDVNITDIAVMSNSAQTVGRVRKLQPHIRGIVEYESLPENLYDVVKESTENGAMTVVLSSADADIKTVTYLQARFKTVWVRAQTDSFGDYFQSIASGALGVIATDPRFVYDTFDYFDGYARNIFNVAHRGLPQNYNENSLGGVEAAVRSGATHIELDGHLTKDKRFVINHDDTVDGVTNGKGVISEMTLSEIKKLDLVLKTPYEKIPTLEEVIDLVDALNAELETDVVLIFEIKDDQADFVQHLKTVLDEKNFYDSIVIITFDSNEHQLENLKNTLPQVPTATLDSVPESTFKTKLPELCRLNTGVDLIHVLQTDSYSTALRDRGFSEWYWTFGAKSDVQRASESGYLGVTNNSADCYAKVVRSVYKEPTAANSREDVPKLGDKVSLIAELYDGTKIEVNGSVTYFETVSGGWRCFAEYEDDSAGYTRRIFSQALSYYLPIEKENPFPVWAIVLCVCGGVAIAAAAAITAVAVLKKRKTDKDRFAE